MSTNTTPLSLALLLLAALPLDAHARTTDNTCYEVEYIEIAESLDTSCVGANDHMVLSGRYCVYADCDPWVVDGYVYDYTAGTYETFSLDGYDVIGWSRINNAGDVVFEAFDAEGASAGFVRHPDGTIDQLPFPGTGEPTSYSAVGINNGGTIVGYVWDEAEGRNRGVIWDGDDYTVLDGPSPGDNYLVDIADNGTVVGVAAWDDGVYGFKDDGSTVTWFGVDDDWWNEALGINNRGQVALYDVNDELGAAYIATKGTLAPLAADDEASVMSFDINNRGVATLEITTDHSRGAIAWPVPCRGR